MPKRGILIIGGSAGSVAPLITILKALPDDLALIIFVIVHLQAQSPSKLPQLLRRPGVFEAVHPSDGEHIRAGYIYIAPPNRHMLVEDNHIRLSAGPKENGFRPAVDPSFRSIARAYGSRVIGLIMSGMLDDGTLGLAAIKRQGGITIVQDPNDAEFSGMPLSAIEHINVDYVQPHTALAPLIAKLARDADLVTDTREEDALMENAQPLFSNADFQSIRSLTFSCPHCGGVLIPRWDGTLIHFECEVKHAYSPLSLFSEQNETLEKALWAALRGFEEKARLAEQILARAQTGEKTASTEIFREKARLAREHAAMLKQIIFGLD